MPSAPHTLLRQHKLQLTIGLLSITAAYLVALPAGHAWLKWGFVIGLLSQPLWFLATLRARQWGMFACSVFYTGAWVQGIVNHF